MVKKELVLPFWVGKTGIREDIEATAELAECLTTALELPSIKKEVLDTHGDIHKLCDLFNNHIMERLVNDKELSDGMDKVTTRIFVGFPESAIGRVNSHLVGTAYSLREYLKGNVSDENRKPQHLNTGFA